MRLNDYSFKLYNSNGVRLVQIHKDINAIQYVEYIPQSLKEKFGIPFTCAAISYDSNGYHITTQGKYYGRTYDGKQAETWIRKINNFSLKYNKGVH